MSKLVTADGVFRLHRHLTEKDFEGVVVKLADEVFGARRVYLDCKRRIGSRGGKQSIPDGYLIDLSRRQEPQLFVVEVETAAHDLFNHVGIQLLQFAFSYSSAPRVVRQALFEEVTARPDVLGKCEAYVREAGLRNLDHFLDELVFDKPFRAIVVIDQATDELHDVLRNFQFSVEVIEFFTYVGPGDKRIYRFAPFLEDVEESLEEGRRPAADVAEIDTVVVPAREDGFQETFLGEDCWYAVRLHTSMIPQIKYIAAYRVAPTSAITHWAPVRLIEPWRDTGKYVLHFAQPASEVGPISLVRGGRIKWLQNLRYTTLNRLLKAKTLDDAF